MKLMLLVVCSVIATSLAGPYSHKEANLETVLNEVEEILQDLKADIGEPHPEPFGDTPRPDEHGLMVEGDISRKKSHKQDELQAVMDGLMVEGDISKKQSHKQESPAMEEMLLHTENIGKAVDEVKAAGGQVMLQLGDELLVAQVPTHVAKQNSFSHASAHISSSVSEWTLRYANAYWMARKERLKPQPKVQKWTEKTAPMALHRDDPDAVFQEGSPYRSTMTGKISFLILIVSGPDDLAFSDDEKQKVINECVDGMVFWSSKANAHRRNTVQFVLHSTSMWINASNPSSCDDNDYSICHDVFVDPALDTIHYPPGNTGKDELAQAYVDFDEADGAFLAFFSKYRQNHFAYAYFGGGPIYMQYSNDGWGPDQLDRVFAHEMGHVFNAPDEYTKCQCSKAYGGGSCTATNDNCNNNNGDDCTSESDQVACIMDSNDMTVDPCSFTKKHLGWC